MLTVLKHNSIKNIAARCLHTTNLKYGYIVLVPEIGEESEAAEKILKPDGLPAFKDITIENCLGAIGYQAAAVEKTVKNIEKAITEQEGRVDNVRIFRELDEVTGPLDTTWGIAKALYLGNCTLIPTKTYMNIHERARKARASKYNSKVLFDSLNQVQNSTGVEKRLHEKFLLEGRLNGLSLNNKKLFELQDVLNQLGKERATFKNKVNMSVHTFSHIINDQQLVSSFPKNLLDAVVKDPNHPDQGPWKITLQPQIVDGFLKYCPDRMQRWNVWQANVRKNSSQMEKSLENSTHLEKIRGLRKRQANILGYKTYVEMSMQTKMVGDVKELKEIFAKLLRFSGPAQAVEIGQLQTFAEESGFQHKLELCDVPYWRRKYLMSHHQLEGEALREFFPLPRVFSGLFALSEKLLNIRIVERKDTQVWQPAVKYYDIFDCDVEDNSSPVGGFYVDCYSKENKFGKNNGWMVSIRNRNETTGATPLSGLIFNFTAPLYGKPYLLSYDDLCLVFKTFGTALQHLLTKSPYTELAGLSNIEWDASQIAGNVIRNLLDSPIILKSISGHYANDEPIPDSVAKSVRLLKTNLAGFDLCQELYYADLDIELHQSEAFWLDVVKKLWPIYRTTPFDKRDSHPCSMTDIFSGDWAAALFSNLHSKVLAADITDAMWQNSEQMSAQGKRFKETFLASGGTVPTAEVFRRFRGRDPSVVALLRSLDIYTETQTTGEL